MRGCPPERGSLSDGPPPDACLVVGLGRRHKTSEQEGDRHEKELPDLHPPRAYAGRVTPKKAKLDHDQATHEAALALPDTVTVAIADLAGELEERLSP